MARFLLALLALAGGVAASQASVLQALEQENIALRERDQEGS